MIHFFFTYTDDASDTPFVRALVTSGVDHAVYARRVDFNYRHRAELLFRRMPALAWYALKSVVWSMFSGVGRPSIVVPASHLQALCFLVARWLLRRDYSIVLLSFIYTERPGHRWLSRVRQAYFRALLSRLQGIICHSEVEVERNGALFGCRATTRFIPLGLHVQGHEQPAPFLAPGASYALSAGRSGRDYRSLSQAFAGLDHPLRIVCDNKAATAGVVSAPNIRILDNCFGSSYLDQLRGADMVVVPLQVSDISAGQMVIIQAMALRKPIITTRTSTSGHYVRDGWNALEVDQGKPAAIAQAVQRLLADPALAAQLAAQGYQTFLASFSMPAFARAVVSTAQDLDQAARRGGHARA